MDKNDLKKDLQNIIEVCKDGVEGYETASGKVEDTDLKTLFLRFSQQRKLFIEELKDEALKLGIELDTSGTIKGFFHRKWLATKATFSSDTNEQVLEDSMTGEKAALDTYAKVLGDPDVPAYLQDSLEGQQKLIKVAITQLNDLKKVTQ